jgi:hypothetical protein
MPTRMTRAGPLALLIEMMDEFEIANLDRLGETIARSDARRHPRFAALHFIRR